MFDLEETYREAFHKDRPHGEPIQLSQDYSASTYLTPLLTCRQFYADAHLLALSRTLFVITNPYIALDVSQRLADRLQPEQISALRHVALVADARHFRRIADWNCHAFNLPLLRLDELSIILHRSSYWHYLFDHNVQLCVLLRYLQGVRRLSFIRNNALIKGTLLTWYNRLIRLILVMDEKNWSSHRQEESWWAWEHCSIAQTVSFSVRPPKPASLTKQQNQELIAPLYETLRSSMELEEEDPDPMSRVSVGM